MSGAARADAVARASAAAGIEGLLRWDVLDNALVVARCQRELRADGIMVVKDVATAGGLRRLRDEVTAAPFNEAANHFTAYQDQGDGRYPADHPRNHRFESTVGETGILLRRPLPAAGVSTGTESLEGVSTP